jgi:hypothetical protein
LPWILSINEETLVNEMLLKVNEFYGKLTGVHANDH